MLANAPSSVLPDTTGILTEDQIVDLGRIKIALCEISDKIESVNAVALDACLPIRPLSNLDARLASNDISRIVCAHEKAENRIRAAAFAAVEKEAA